MLSENFQSLLAKLRPVIGEMADTLWLTALLDPARQQDMHAVAQALSAEVLGESYIERHILLEPPPRDNVSGEYPLGTVIYADKPVCRLGLREHDFPQHIAVLGRSGAGKTNVGYLLVWNLLRKQKPFLILDWRGNYTHFLHRPEGKNIQLFTLGESESLSFNPLSPPVNLNQNQKDAYIRDLLSVIITTYLPGYQLLSTRGVEYLFLKAVEYFAENEPKPITFNDIQSYIQKFHAQPREMDWKVSAQNILLKLTTGPIGRLMNSDGNVKIDDILDRPVILLLNSLGSETDRKLFSKILLLWLYYYRLTEDKPNTFKHALIIEEAHHIFIRRHQGGQSVCDMLLRQMRELGESLILLDQNPSLMSVPALGNTATTICLNLKHADDLEAAGKAMTLPQDNWTHIGRLPIGQGIVKLPDRWAKPFLVKFPQFPVSRPEKPSLPKSKDSGSDSLRKSFQEFQFALNEAILALPLADRREKENQGSGSKEHDLLIDIAKYPLSVITERYKRIGWSARTGDKIKRRLLEKGLIEQEKVTVPNGSVTLLKLTDAGRGYLTTYGIKVKHLPKNASLEHEYYKELVARQYRKEGYQVRKEVPIGEGKAVDLVATKGDEKIAIELETGKSDVQGNIRKCKKAGYDSVLSISTSKNNSMVTKKIE
jgi:Helicase HerA, central domain